MRGILLLTMDPVQMKEFRAELAGLPGIHIEEANSTRTASEVMRRAPVEILVADLFLGETNALDLLKNMRKTSDRLTFILITRMKDRGVIDRAFRFGAADVLTYPMSKGTLRETLKHRLHTLGAAIPAIPKAEANGT